MKTLYDHKRFSTADQDQTFSGTFASTIADIASVVSLFGSPLASFLDDVDMDFQKRYCCPKKNAQKWTKCSWYGEPNLVLTTIARQQDIQYSLPTIFMGSVNLVSLDLNAVESSAAILLVESHHSCQFLWRDSSLSHQKKTMSTMTLIWMWM